MDKIIPANILIPLRRKVFCLQMNLRYWHGDSARCEETAVSNKRIEISANKNQRSLKNFNRNAKKS